MTTGYMPDMTCPSCGCRWIWHDYHEVREGDERTCEECDKTAVVAELEFLMHATLTVKGK
jgi:hypothetical protein